MANALGLSARTTHHKGGLSIVLPGGWTPDAAALLQALTDAVQPHVEYKEWRILQELLPESVRAPHGGQSEQPVLSTMIASLAHAHDVAILSSRVHDAAATRRSAHFHLTTHISWVDDASWISQHAEMELRFDVDRKAKGHWTIERFEAITFSPLGRMPVLGQTDQVVPASGRVLVCTTATDRRSGLADLEQSCTQLGIPLCVFGKGAPWLGSSHNKLKGLYWELEKRQSEYEYALFTDAYDSVVASNLDCILQKFIALDTPLLFGAEVNCFPASDGQKAADYPKSATKYRYLNAGGFMGRVDYLLDVMKEWDAANSFDSGMDQQWWAHLYVSGKTRITLDHDCQIFQCLFMCEDDLELLDSGVRNRITGSSPCIVHGNGGAHLRPVADHILGRRRSRWRSVWGNLKMAQKYIGG